MMKTALSTRAGSFGAGPVRPAAPRERRSGFTLVEVIGAFFMMTIILIFVTGIFVENGRQREAATELMRVQTTAAATLDLIAQDLEAAAFVARPQSRPPQDHPFVFRADRIGPLGATFLRFPTQNVSRGNLGEHASTWVEVIYFLTEEEADPGESERFTLWRWRSTRPPNDPAPFDPDLDDPRSARVVEGIADFGLVFVDDQGVSYEEWDSAFVPSDRPLPIAAEIRLSLYRDARPGESDTEQQQIPAEAHVRHVSLPMYRPIDLDQLIALAQSGEEGPNCATIDDCLALGEKDWFYELLDNGCNGDEELCSVLSSSGETCWADVTVDWPELVSQADPACESLP